MRFENPDERPYFLWSESTTVAQFRQALAQAGDDEKAMLLGWLMREARDPDVPEVRRLLLRSSAPLGVVASSGCTC